MSIYRGLMQFAGRIAWHDAMVTEAWKPSWTAANAYATFARYSAWPIFPSAGQACSGLLYV